MIQLYLTILHVYKFSYSLANNSPETHQVYASVSLGTVQHMMNQVDKF